MRRQGAGVVLGDGAVARLSVRLRHRPALTFAGRVVDLADGVDAITFGLACVNASGARLGIESLINEYRIRSAPWVNLKSPED